MIVDKIMTTPLANECCRFRRHLDGTRSPQKNRARPVADLENFANAQKLEPCSTRERFEDGVHWKGIIS